MIDPEVRFGILSDIDDTVMVTALPRPLLAAWNTFVLDEHARTAVPGMAVLYERLVTAHPGAPVFYLSTGAWNVAPDADPVPVPAPLPGRARCCSPTGGRRPTAGSAAAGSTSGPPWPGWPRSSPTCAGCWSATTASTTRRSTGEFAAAHPENVAGVAIRRLSPTQSVLAGSLPVPTTGSSAGPVGQKWLSAPDGAGLWKLLRAAGLV